MAASPAGEVLEFVGPPRRLSLVSDAAIAPDAVFTGDKQLQPFLEGVAHPFRATARAGAGARRYKLRLSPTTPPGAYKATIRTGDVQHKASVTVQAAPRLTVLPAELRLDGRPGGRISETLTVWNRGNVVIDLADHAVVGLFDNDGLETAFASTYRENPDDVQGVLTHFFKRLRESHGGLLKLSVATTGGTIAPGAQARVQVSGRLPSALRAGHGYHGVWRTPFANIAVSVAAASEEST
jgi:hypothetical protein